jgi:hypothetical protein
MLGLFQFSIAFLLTTDELISLLESLHAVDPNKTLEQLKTDITAELADGRASVKMEGHASHQTSQAKP